MWHSFPGKEGSERVIVETNFIEEEEVGVAPILRANCHIDSRESFWETWLTQQLLGRVAQSLVSANQR